MEKDGSGPVPWVRVVVCAPYGGTEEAIRLLAEDRKWPIIEPPSPDEILKGGTQWLSEVAETERTPLVIPQLEQCYLRHYNGLGLMRKLLDWLMSNRRYCLIGCSSWAWAYLNNVQNLNLLLSTPFALEALDDKRLLHWFQQLAHQTDKKDFVIRQTDDGSIILPPSKRSEASLSEDDCNSQDSSESNGFLTRLAAYSRGIPGIAWAIWRQSLRLVSETDVKQGAIKAAVQDRGKTIWVKPWDKLEWPGIPDDADRSQLFVLLTILLHSGLPPRLLRQLLSISEIDVLETLHHLRETRLLRADELKKLWHITPIGYPVIRQVLKRTGYLVDDI
jgi:hypothetical protein